MAIAIIGSGWGMSDLSQPGTFITRQAELSHLRTYEEGETWSMTLPGESHETTTLKSSNAKGLRGPAGITSRFASILRRPSGADWRAAFSPLESSEATGP